MVNKLLIHTAIYLDISFDPFIPFRVKHLPIHFFVAFVFHRLIDGFIPIFITGEIYRCEYKRSNFLRATPIINAYVSTDYINDVTGCPIFRDHLDNHPCNYLVI